MENQVSRRGKIRVRLYASVLILVLFSAFVINAQKASELSRQLNADAERSLSTLEACMSSINTNLTKGLYANTTPMLSSMAISLTRDAASAKNSLSALPLSDTQLDNMLKFLSQVGAFVSTLDRKLSLGEPITSEERNQLKQLIDVSQKLLSELDTITQGVENGSVSFKQAGSTLQKSADQSVQIDSAFGDAEQTLTDYPTLIYDGPFSDHILNQSPKTLEGKSDISKEKALEIASDFIGIDKSTLRFDSETNGVIETYNFFVDSINISVCKKGGAVLYLLGSSSAGESVISPEQAVENAENFLSAKGYENMKESYYSTQDGICTVNFAYENEGVICYPDLIKLSVSLETGNIISFDARGYIMNHTDRPPVQSKISADEAKMSVSDYLTVMSSRLAVIPTDYKTEKTAYEFHCKTPDEQEVLVYIDVLTAKEDDILLLLYSDGGILTK
ncbi:MAG: germination protein YpeB [Ruminococcus sp.]|nr:germination protein YpeB [Ruminococcus sp.]MDY4909855.1 germination protein YpeB [Candidatus Fimenecus sp.]